MGGGFKSCDVLFKSEGGSVLLAPPETGGLLRPPHPSDWALKKKKNLYIYIYTFKKGGFLRQAGGEAARSGQLSFPSDFGLLRSGPAFPLRSPSSAII